MRSTIGHNRSYRPRFTDAVQLWLLYGFIVALLCTSACCADEPPSITLSPAQALQVYQQRAAQQLDTLTSYSDETFITAELRETGQQAEFLLKRTFSPPRSLTFSVVTSSGSAFVKHEVIARVLHEEVARVQKGKGMNLAILADNYKFLFKGIEGLEGRTVYAFEVKPRRKQAGLFKGKIFLDCREGHIARSTGRLVRTPSWWVKRVDFVRDYADLETFTFPVRTQVTAQARLVGRISITVVHSGYQLGSEISQTSIRQWQTPTERPMNESR
jgi:hypothetical protein